MQDLIVKLQLIPSSKNSQQNELNPKKIASTSVLLSPAGAGGAFTDLESKMAQAEYFSLEYLNELEREQKAQKLDELKRNKQRLLDLLKEKENELANLAKMTSSVHSFDEAKAASMSAAASNNKLINQSMGSDFGGSEIESKFKTAENDFECLSVEDVGGECKSNVTKSKLQQQLHHSPSDLLWNQMKKQLNMRESMRNKKKELEDLIRDEYRIGPLPMDKMVRFCLI